MGWLDYLLVALLAALFIYCVIRICKRKSGPCGGCQYRGECSKRDCDKTKEKNGKK